MSLGPAVFTARPFPTIARIYVALTLVLVGVALVTGGAVRIGLFCAAVCGAGLVGWYLWRARSAAVLIDAHQFIVKAGGSQDTFDLDQIDQLDLSPLRGRVRFRDGTSVVLPLDGPELVEVGLLLAPRGGKTRRP